MTCEVPFEPEGESPSVERLCEFLGDRRWYDISEARTVYRDEDTGVAFELTWTVDDGTCSEIRFASSFLRPRFWGLEAAGELEALVAEFELAPRRDDGGGELGTFDAEDFIEGWDRGNRAAIASADEEGESLPAYRMDAERLRDAWRWNRSRQDYQAVLGEGIFVPAVRFLAGGGAVHRACVWPETIPVALPEAADLVLISGVEAEGLTSEPSELRVAEDDRVTDVISAQADKIEKRSDPTDHLLVGWARPPEDLLAQLATLGEPADDRELERISPEEILDEELA